MYTTESYTTSIAVSDYKKRYIDIPTFTEYCKACPNFTRSCPGLSSTSLWRLSGISFRHWIYLRSKSSIMMTMPENNSRNTKLPILCVNPSMSKKPVSAGNYSDLKKNTPAPSVFQPAPVACAMTIVHVPTACHAVIPTNSVIPSNLLAAMSV